MTTRKFEGSFDVSFEVEIEQEVFDAVDDDFKKYLYDLDTDDEIVEHVVSCLLRRMSLSQLDGWADQPDSNVFMIDEDWYLVKLEERSIFDEGSK